MQKKVEKRELELGKELGQIYEEISLLGPEQMRMCNSDFVQSLHEEAEKDEKYKNFKTAVLATCFTQIESEKNLKIYLDELDKVIKKLDKEVKELYKYDSGEGNFWENITKKLGEEKCKEGLGNFYYVHFLIAQRLVLGSWLAKKKRDSVYWLKGFE